MPAETSSVEKKVASDDANIWVVCRVTAMKSKSKIKKGFATQPPHDSNFTRTVFLISTTVKFRL